MDLQKDKQLIREGEEVLSLLKNASYDICCIRNIALYTPWRPSGFFQWKAQEGTLERAKKSLSKVQEKVPMYSENLALVYNNTDSSEDVKSFILLAQHFLKDSVDYWLDDEHSAEALRQMNEATERLEVILAEHRNPSSNFLLYLKKIFHF